MLSLTYCLVLNQFQLQFNFSALARSQDTDPKFRNLLDTVQVSAWLVLIPGYNVSLYHCDIDKCDLRVSGEFLSEHPISPEPFFFF